MCVVAHAQLVPQRLKSTFFWALSHLKKYKKKLIFSLWGQQWHRAASPKLYFFTFFSPLCTTAKKLNSIYSCITLYIQVKITSQCQIEFYPHFSPIGKRPAPIAADLSREYGKYKDAHSMALDSNATLHKAIQLNLNNLKKLSTPLGKKYAFIK